MRTALIALLFAIAAAAAPVHGLVKGAGLPLPGATVEATQAGKTVTTTTGGDGAFVFADLAPGVWTVRVAMTGFVAVEKQITVPVEGVELDLTVAPFQAKMTAAKAVAPPATAATISQAGAQEALAINGSVDNGAASNLGMSPAFGNNRPRVGSLFNGGIGLIYGTSALDARSYSFTGQDTARPSFNNLTGLFQFGGPMLIPHLTNLNDAPFFFVAYEKSASHNIVNAPALVPTAAQRATPNMNAQAAALLALYPEANLASGGAYNYQAAVSSPQHQDRLQTRITRGFGFANQLSGSLSLSSTRADAGSVFGFNDRTSTLGMDVHAGWRHSFSRSVYVDFSYDYTRQATQTTPFFANLTNVEGGAGIMGGDAAARDWGPPTLSFSDGITPLTDGVYAHNRNQTAAWAAAGYWNHVNHNVEFGGDFRRLEFNLLSQQNPRGTFTFNGDATGDAFGDFASGTPDAAALNLGNADKYFRQSAYDGYVTDDWRFSDSISLNLGARWEYAAPATERQDRMVNLDTGTDFATANAVAGSPLLHADYAALEPRLGLAWRPIAASSLLLRAGYGIYRDTSVYENIALQMAEQAPFAISLAAQNTASTPLTLATALQTPLPATPDIFAIDPNFRVGYVQTWNASMQRDLPDGMVMTLSYLGDKGTHGAQLFFPNTAPPGVAPCGSCPVGFLYEASNGSSTYESGKALLQRRFHNGLAATVSYTYAHAIDDASVGGTGSPGGGASGQVIAQDWLNLDGERARSDFDQRHKLTLVTQYSTGSRRWGGAVLHGWTVTSNLTAASGLPLNPTTLEIIPGTGTPGVRPNATGVAGVFAAPTAGEWGTAGRNSMDGPSEFSLDGALQRSFPLPHLFGGGVTAALRIDATNVLNHVSFTQYGTLFGSPQFGLPVAANAMRSLQTTVRFTW